MCDEQANWYPDIEDMKRKFTSRTVGIVLINPNNPTGAVYPTPLLQGMVSLQDRIICNLRRQKFMTNLIR